MNPNPSEVEYLTLRASVKAVESDDPNGSFEAVLSLEGADREGESITPGAFNPLPAEIPIYVEHDWRSGALPVAKAVPYYEGDVLKCKGTFAPTDRAQNEIRPMVKDGFLKSMSVGFLNGKRAVIAGLKSVTSGDLFESSFTAIPVKVGAEVLSVKAGARNSKTDAQRLQEIHDLATANGATCGTTKSVTVKAIDNSVEALQARVRDALEDAYGDYATFLRGVIPSSDLTSGGSVVFDWYAGDGDTYQQSYTDDGSVVTLEGEAVEVDIHEVIAPDADADRETESGPTMLSLAAAETDTAPAAQAADAASESAAAKARLRVLTASVVK